MEVAGEIGDLIAALLKVGDALLKELVVIGFEADFRSGLSELYIQR